MTLVQKPYLKKIVFHCIFILAVYAILLLIRLPILVNADYFLGSDEGFMAADMADLFNGGPLSFYHENVSYEGAFNSLVAIPFFWVFGVSSLAFKLPAVLVYALYIWTFFLLVMRLNSKIAWVSVALLVLCPPKILVLTTANYAQIYTSLIANVVFLIYFSNKDNPSCLKVFYITFLMGFSFYIYTYSVIYLAVLIILWILDSQISLRNVLERFKPSCFREGCARFVDIIVLLNLSWILLSYIAGGISLKLGDFNLFNGFMRGSTPHYLAWNSSKLYAPFVEFLVFMVLFRVVIFRADIMRSLERMKDSPSIRLWGIGSFGFLTGLTPRWIGFYEKSVSGHPGYELDLGLPQMWHKLSDLVSIQLPRIFELNSYSGILVGVLMGVAVFNFMRRDKVGVEIIFAILPIVLLSVMIIYQKPNAGRHLFPICGVVVFYIASLLFNVEKKSIHSFWVLLAFLGSYYGYATYGYYKDQNIIKGFSILKKDTMADDVIRYSREKQFQAVYTNYHAHKFQFLSGGNPSFAEFYSNPKCGWKRKQKMGAMTDFAVFIPRNSEILAVYQSHLKDKKITCDRENINEHVVLSRCHGNLWDLFALRSLVMRRTSY